MFELLVFSGIVILREEVEDDSVPIACPREITLAVPERAI
jgi:hypothetical protein